MSFKADAFVQQIYMKAGIENASQEAEKYCNKFRGRETLMFETLEDEHGISLVRPYLVQWEAEKRAANEGKCDLSDWDSKPGVYV